MLKKIIAILILAFVASVSFAGEVKSAKLVMGAEAYSVLEFGKIIYSERRPSGLWRIQHHLLYNGEYWTCTVNIEVTVAELTCRTWEVK